MFLYFNRCLISLDQRMPMDDMDSFSKFVRLGQEADLTDTVAWIEKHWSCGDR